jgi:hypothetical protein
MCYLGVRNKEELQKIIVPFFTKYNINTEKHRDFLNFAFAVSILYKNKGKGLKNLTQEQREHLDFCISQMNKNRYSPEKSLKRTKEGMNSERANLLISQAY